METKYLELIMGDYSNYATLVDSDTVKLSLPATTNETAYETTLNFNEFVKLSQKLGRKKKYISKNMIIKEGTANFDPTRWFKNCINSIRGYSGDNLL